MCEARASEVQRRTKVGTLARRRGPCAKHGPVPTPLAGVGKSHRPPARAALRRAVRSSGTLEALHDACAPVGLFRIARYPRPGWRCVGPHVIIGCVLGSIVAVRVHRGLRRNQGELLGSPSFLGAARAAYRHAPLHLTLCPVSALDDHGVPKHWRSGGGRSKVPS